MGKDRSQDHTPQFRLGAIVAFTAENDAKRYWLGTVLALVGDDAAKLHYHDTRSSKVRSARFLPVYIETPSGLSILTAKMTKRLLSRGNTAEPWTGVIEASDILNDDVRLTSSHKLSASSSRSLSQYEHMVLG